MMKKIVSVLALMTAISSACAADGTINFTGNIIDSACTVDLDGAGATTMDVAMGNVSKSSFTGVGSTAGGNSSATKFNILLKNCPETVSTATVKFDGTAYSGDNSVLALTDETGVATGVGIQLSDNSGVLSLFTESAAYTLTSGSNTNTLDFTARYIQKAATVTAGKANSVATFTVNY
ncbi:ferrous iron transporter B [Erwinia mallotivora]|uniref:Ferrous iron transporter B n=2 Tax=Erwinia mallotivora TaxID=69222 RepID=A0A014M6E0_9GAMM|nr:fimbrial protein [Erwinia mallotivora]EXU77356.1 ferrous iron transporter B [Erwinia mallotivora]